MFHNFVLMSHVAIAVFLILIVLLQQGRGADLGASFGGGGGNTLFGASGADNFLTRVTTVAAFLFMFTSVLLALDAKRVTTGGSELFKDAQAPAQTAPAAAPIEVPAPVVPAPAAAPAGETK